jgi:hypothetical protein
MSIDQTFTPWEASGLYVDLTGTISADFGARDIILRNIDTGPWPMPGREPAKFSLLNNGVAMMSSSSYAQGRQDVAFTLKQPLTPIPAALFLMSCLQNHAAYATTLYNIYLPTDSTAKYFWACARGKAGTGLEGGVATAAGLISKTVKIGIPMVDNLGGECTLESDIMGYSSAWTDAIAGTSGTADAATPILSTGCSLTVGGAAAGFVSANIQVDNKVMKDPGCSANPSAYILGDPKYGVEITGDITVMMEPDSTAPSVWHTLKTNQNANPPTATALVWTLGGIVFTSSVIFNKPTEPSIQGNIYVQTFPWTAVYTSATNPGFAVTVADLFTTAWAA